MFLKIKNKFLFNKKLSCLIGDKVSDQKMAKKSKIKFYFANNNKINERNFFKENAAS